MELQKYESSVPDIAYSIPTVTFNGYEFYREQAVRIAQYVRSIEVTEENITAVKQELATARKGVKELDRRRIDIKKEIQSGYAEFERQLKEITAIIDDADKELGAKVRVLDEAERDRKKEQVRALWEKRVQQYAVNALDPNAFEKWLTPQHLNKTTTMKSIESDMVDWLEQREKDIELLRTMDDEYLVEYLGTYDTTSAISAVNLRHQMLETVRETAEPDEEKAIFVVHGKKDIKLAETILTENEINFERK